MKQRTENRSEARVVPAVVVAHLERSAKTMRFATILFAIFCVDSHAQEKKPMEITTPHGTVAWKELPSDKDGKVAVLMREVSIEELRMLKMDAQSAAAFVKRYVPAGKKASHPLDELDFAFEGWLRSDDPKKESAERVVRILGSAYGSYCIDHLGVRWAWIKDEYGQDIALVRENPTARGFPFTSIRYRIEDKKVDFIYALYASLAHLIAEASHEKKPNKAPEPTPGSVTPRATEGKSK
jgi:hypothetical protein